MYIVTIRRKEERRTGRDRRKSSLSGDGSARGASAQSRRKVDDRRNVPDRRKAMTFELPADQRPTIEKIIGMLEKSIVKSEPKVQKAPPVRAGGMRATEAAILALNVLYSKKCGGGFNQLEVFADPVREMYIVRNKATRLEAEIPSHWLNREKGSKAESGSHESEIVRAFKKLGKPCKD